MWSENEDEHLRLRPYREEKKRKKKKRNQKQKPEKRNKSCGREKKKHLILMLTSRVTHLIGDASCSSFIGGA